MSRSVKQQKTKGFLDQVSLIRKHRKLIIALKAELLLEEYEPFEFPAAAN